MTTAWGGQPPNLNSATQTHWGNAAIGILGSVMKAAWTSGEHGPSPLANDALSDGLEYRWYVESLPSGCSIDATELGDAALNVPADGTYSWTYRLVESGTLLSPAGTVTTTVGTGAGVVTAAVAGQAAFSIVAAGAISASVVTLPLAVAVAGLAGFSVTAIAAVAAAVLWGVLPATVYCTQADLERRFGLDELVQVTNPTNPQAVVVDVQRVSDAIADVEALITARISARYRVPLATVPLLLRNLACDLVRARLYEDRMPDHVGKRETAALKLLDEIGGGGLQLGLDAAAQVVSPAAGPQFISGGRVFSASLLDDYR